MYGKNLSRVFSIFSPSTASQYWNVFEKYKIVLKKTTFFRCWKYNVQNCKKKFPLWQKTNLVRLVVVMMKYWNDIILMTKKKNVYTYYVFFGLNSIMLTDDSIVMKPLWFSKWTSIEMSMPQSNVVRVTNYRTN